MVRYRGRLQFRAAILVAIASLPLLFLTMTSALEHRRHLEEEITGRSVALVGNLAAEVERLVDSSRLVLAALSRVPEIADRTPGACSAFALDIMEDFPQFTNLGAVTNEGEVYCSGLDSIGDPESPATLDGRAVEAAVRAALQSREFAVGGYVVGRESLRVVVPVALPLENGEGVVFASTDLTWVGDALRRFAALPEGAVLALSTPEGVELTRSPADRTAPHVTSPSFLAAVATATEGEGGALRVGGATGNRLVAYQRLPTGHAGNVGILSVAIPSQVAYRVMAEGLTRNLFLGGFLILLASLLAWTGAAALIRRPVERLVGLARRLADGELEARADVDGAEGELGELGTALNEMASALQNREALLEEAREALMESEQRFRAIQETSPDAFVLTRSVRSEGEGTIEDFRIVYANPAAEAMLPPGVGSPLGRTLAELNPTIRSEGRLAAFREVVETGMPLKIEVPMSRLEGPPRWVRITAVKVEDGVGVAYSDITESRELEEQLFQAQKLEAVGRLAGGGGHDFNNLLTVIAGTTDLLLLDLKDEPEVEEGLHEIRLAASRASELTNQLLAYSRRQSVQPRLVNVNDVLKEMDGMLRRLLGDRVALTLRLDPELNPVRVDPGYLSQVVVNLAVNARDAMPGGGEVMISTTSETLTEDDVRTRPDVLPGYYVVLAVQDSGKGIPDQIRGRIFEPFFTTKPRGAGTGLGLSTVYGIVRQSEGHVEVESVEGRGSTFRVLLPGVEEWPDSRVHQNELIAMGSETVLIVEDDQEVTTLVGGILRRFGYETLAAGGAEEALALSRSHPGTIHLLLSDVIVPGVSGLDLADRLVRERPGLKVLFMSVRTDDVVAAAGLGGTAHLLDKPFTPIRVARRVRDILDGPGGGNGARD